MTIQLNEILPILIGVAASAYAVGHIVGDWRARRRAQTYSRFRGSLKSVLNKP